MELSPTTPAPSTTTWAGGTPGTPPSSMPAAAVRLLQVEGADVAAIRPATSDMGVSSGSRPVTSWMVS